jgi:hypothetical protein
MITVRPLKNLILPRGLRPRTVRGGRLKGVRCYLDLSKSTQPWRGVYERCLQDWLAKNVKEGATCLDIGASDGYFSLLMSKLAGPQGSIFAFEPGEDGSQILKNFELNPKVPLARVEVFRKFVSAESSDQSVSIDALVMERNLPRVDVIKIDVDGAEIDVLQGMSITLERFHPHLFIEVHSEGLLEKVKSITDGLGYNMKLEQPPAHEQRPIEFNVFYFSV